MKTVYHGFFCLTPIYHAGRHTLNTKLLKIRLVMMTLALLALIYVMAAIIVGGHDDLRVAAIILLTIIVPLFGWTVGGWAGLASYLSSEKEARRGIAHNDRP